MKNNLKTIKAFVNQSGMNESLVRAVIRQSGGYDSFKEHAQDVCSHGANAGFSGFIYHNDTVPFAKRNKEAIVKMCEDMASDFGQSGVIEFIASFHCLKGISQSEVADGLYNPRSGNKTEVFNAMAWYALEEVARRYCDIADDVA